MNNPSNQIELIEAYLAKELSDAECAQFERQLSEDTQLREVVDFEQALREGISYTHLKDVQTSLIALDKGLDQTLTLSNDQNLKNHKPLLRIAAVLIPMIVIASIFLLREDKTPRLSDFLIEYFEPYENEIISTSRGYEGGQNEVQLAFLSYDRKEFVIASEMFEQLLESDSENELLLFFYGNSLLGSGDPKASIDIFEKYLFLEGGLSDETKWYLSLAYYASGMEMKAIQMLEKLVVSEHSYRERAIELLDNIRPESL